MITTSWNIHEYITGAWQWCYARFYYLKPSGASVLRSVSSFLTPSEHSFMHILLCTVCTHIPRAPSDLPCSPSTSLCAFVQPIHLIYAFSPHSAFSLTPPLSLSLSLSLSRISLMDLFFHWKDESEVILKWVKMKSESTCFRKSIEILHLVKGTA